MADDTYLWRKLPRNLIKDENVRYISELLPDHLKNAPLLFLIVAISISDNEGIFDLEDGIIFSRLMNCGKPQDVFTVANLLMRRRLIIRIGETTKCILSNWEYSKNEKPRTLEERRNIVSRQIEEEKRLTASKTFNFSAQNNSADFFGDAFFCPINDKNTENVVMDFLDDKIKKNVVKKNQTEKIREDKTRLDQTRLEGEREEHTQDKTDREIRETEQMQGLQADFRAFRPCEEKKETADKLEITEVIQEEQTEMAAGESVNLADIALSLGEPSKVEKQSSQAYSILYDFFARNCLGFEQTNYSECLTELARRMEQLADDANPVEVIAAVLCGQFKKLSEDEGYYKNMPLTPEMFLKGGVYAHVLAAGSRILLNKKADQSKWTKAMNEYSEEVRKEQAAIGNGFDSEYIKYGIDPTAPDRAMQLLIAQQREKGGNNPP